MPTRERLAAIDIGTVTTRLLVADVDDSVVREVVRRQAITHLGEGLTDTGTLSPDAIERVARTVGIFNDTALDLGANRVVAYATSAARDASNGDALLDACEARGIRPRIIAGEREAALSFVGATYDIDGKNVLVTDVGGGSTELVLGSVTIEEEAGRQATVTFARSIDVGSRRVTELFLRSDPPTRSEVAEASAWVAEQLRPYFGQLRARPSVMVSVAGTATTLAAIDLALDPYDPLRIHGYRLLGGRLAEIRAELSAMALERRRLLPGLDPARAGVIVGGAIVLETVLAMAGVDSTLVSEHDILYGIMLGLYRGGGEATA
ncbi:MAG: Ppx/GppA family phosphatase [Coriobacteriia bacterium]|nr:Ppx/GppA family phosphatase [Coriobacteriia bacterium]